MYVDESKRRGHPATEFTSDAASVLISWGKVARMSRDVVDVDDIDLTGKSWYDL